MLKKTTTFVLKIIESGTRDLKPYDHGLGVTKGINAFSLVIFAINLIFGPIYFISTGKIAILAGSMTEAAFVGGLIFLNYYNYRTAANILFFLVLNAATLYFGVMLGQAVGAALMIVFLTGLTLYMFRSWRVRLLCMATSISVLVLMEANYKLKVIPAVNASETNSDYMRWTSYAVIIFLVTMLFYAYAWYNSKLLRRLQDYYDQEVAQNMNKARFIRNAYHEVKVQFWGVLSVTKILGRSRENHTAKEMQNFDDLIETLRTGCKNLEIVLTNILEYSQYDAGIIPKALYEPFDLRFLLQTIVDGSKYAAAERKVQVRLNYSPLVPDYIVSDKTKMIQIVTNLINNAVKFTKPETFIYVEVANSRERWTIAVKDKGNGIPPERLGQLFKTPFFTDRSDGNPKGIGLGLHITGQLVKTLNGEIEVESQPGQGTTFSVSLPILDYSENELVGTPRYKESIS